MTRQTMRSIAMALGALALGLFPAFFVAASVFADGQWVERSFLMPTTRLDYCFLGSLAGLLSASRSARSGSRSTRQVARSPSVTALALAGG